MFFSTPRGYADFLTKRMKNRKAAVQYYAAAEAGKGVGNPRQRVQKTNKPPRDPINIGEFSASSDCGMSTKA